MQLAAEVVLLRLRHPHAKLCELAVEGDDALGVEIEVVLLDHLAPPGAEQEDGAVLVELGEEVITMAGAFFQTLVSAVYEPVLAGASF